ncbi:MAG: VOC family protein [Actinomycetota bacterium]
MTETAGSPVRELRVALTVQDFDRAVRFYRDALGLPVEERWDRPDGRGMVLAAGRATIELVDELQAETIDRIEVGTRTSGSVRLALQVADSAGTAGEMVDAGGALVGGPVDTPWRHRNVRVRAPDGMQLTLFTPLDS